jgi:hypothetical protein
MLVTASSQLEVLALPNQTFLLEQALATTRQSLTVIQLRMQCEPWTVALSVAPTSTSGDQVDGQARRWLQGIFTLSPNSVVRVVLVLEPLPCQHTSVHRQPGTNTPPPSHARTPPLPRPPPPGVCRLGPAEPAPGHDSPWGELLRGKCSPERLQGPGSRAAVAGDDHLCVQLQPIPRPLPLVTQS